jgi:hypothetical protein
MTDFRDFKGAAKRLDDIDIPRIGATIGVGEDEIHAFMDVEAAGAGFDSQGRPKMLFEPHKFYANLPSGKRAAAVKAGLAYPTWGAKKYPADSYPRLKAAMAIDETAALESASWGLGQILGENHEMLGYATVQSMVLAFMDDEEAHLEGIVAFLIKAGIADDLKAHRWTSVARVYNGPSHYKHNYAGRMAAAFARWQKIKDTPWVPGEQPAPTTTMPVLRKGAGWGKHAVLKPYVVKAQNRLMVHGFDAGSFDGKFGDQTEKAVKAFQAARGFTPDGVIGGFETWPALLAEPANTLRVSTAAATPSGLVVAAISPEGAPLTYRAEVVEGELAIPRHIPPPPEMVEEPLSTFSAIGPFAIGFGIGLLGFIAFKILT